MKPTDVLTEEHGGIKIMLSILEKVCGELEKGVAVDPGHLSEMIDFFREFADKCHHGKEEDLLFKELEKYDLGAGNELARELEKEHEEGREYVKKMAKEVDGYTGEGEASPEVLVRLGRGYVEFLREHIRKEDEDLWPMVDEKLGEEAKAGLVEEFERFEVEKIGAGKHDEYHELIHKLEKEYLGDSGHGHHHHHHHHDH